MFGYQGKGVFAARSLYHVFCHCLAFVDGVSASAAENSFV